MTRRHIASALACLFAGTVVSPVVAGDASAYGPTLRFAAWRNGTEIGSHVVRFEHEGGRLKAVTSIDLRVRMLGFTVYRYLHRAEEIWQGDALWSLSSTTDDNGDVHAVRAARHDGGIDVWRSPPESGRAESSEAAGTPLRMPAGIVPTTHWNVRQVRQSTLLNSQLGTAAKVRIESAPMETVRTATGSVASRRYRYSGDLIMEQWFDAADRWVKMAFTARDGSRIEYVLQE